MWRGSDFLACSAVFAQVVTVQSLTKDHCQLFAAAAVNICKCAAVSICKCAAVSICKCAVPLPFR